MKSLTHFLSQIPDHRRKQGQRISLPSFLSMVILGNMSGYTSLQSLARFFKNNENFFTDKFSLYHGVPGYTRIRTLLLEIEFEHLTDAFFKWSSQFIEKGDWIHMDGKGLSSTITNYNDSYQNFHYIVCSFCNRTGISLSAATFESKKQSEIKTVQEMIELFADKGVIITLDALHCQKKPPKKSWMDEMII